MRGIYNIGNVKKTKRQKKKHVSQMSETEKQYLKNKIKTIKTRDITVSKHILNKKKDIGFKMENIFEILNEDKIENLIVEYNETQNDELIDKRVLLRGNKSYNVRFKSKEGSFVSSANICFVISLNTYRIVTVYWNKSKDNHKTINWSRYDKNLDIIKSLGKEVGFIFLQ